MLNDQQRAAVEHPLDCQLQIVAGPGTGKTNTLTGRVVHLLDHEKVPPEELIVLTFTNQAAREMRARVMIKLAAADKDKVFIENIRKRLIIGTFHSICYRFLRKHATRVLQMEQRAVADEDEKKEYLSIVLRDECLVNLIKSKKLSIHDMSATALVLQDSFNRIIELKIRDLVLWISQKKTGADPTSSIAREGEKEPISGILEHIYKGYEEQLRLNKKYDFDDLMVFCKDMLEKDPSVVAHIKAVLVDEFQDTDNLQLQLTYLFAQARHNITVVGDPDQCIYTFRGAKPINFSYMRERYPGCKIVILEENYRSVKPVLDIASALIAQDRQRLPSKLFSTHEFAVKCDSKPLLTRFPNAIHARRAMESHIRHIIDISQGQVTYKDFAILCRTHRDAKFYQNMHQTPVKYIGGREFWERPVIQHILNYMRVINNIEDAIFVRKTINVPKQGLGPVSLKFCDSGSNTFNALGTTMKQKFEFISSSSSSKRAGDLQELSAKAAASISSYYNFILSCQDDLKEQQQQEGNGVDTSAITTIVWKIYERIKRSLLNQAVHNDVDSDSELWEDAYQEQKVLLESSVKILEGIFQDAMEALNNSSATDDEMELYQELGTLGYLLSNVTLGVENGKDKPLANSVSIGTIHSAKGLEWPFVFTPISGFRRPDSDITEELRLMFVTMTRAKVGLFMSFAAKEDNYGNAYENMMPEMIDQIRHLYEFRESDFSFESFKDDQWENGFKFLGLDVSVAGMQKEGFVIPAGKDGSGDSNTTTETQIAQTSWGNSRLKSKLKLKPKMESKRGLDVSHLPNAGFSSAASLLNFEDLKQSKDSKKQNKRPLSEFFSLDSSSSSKSNRKSLKQQ